MNRDEITRLFEELNHELSAAGIQGEVTLYGGAVMCLAYEARPSTRDVDAIFRPASDLRNAIRKLAKKHGLREDWLNDAVKGFVVTHPSRILLDLSNLKIYVPEPDYVLAMKAMSARVDTVDKEDVIFLIRKLGIKTPQEIFAIIEKYYPRHRIKAATQFFIEELFEK